MLALQTVCIGVYSTKKAILRTQLQLHKETSYAIFSEREEGHRVVTVDKDRCLDGLGSAPGFLNAQVQVIRKVPM